MKIIFVNRPILNVLLLSLLFLAACSERSDGPSEIVRARPPSPYHVVKKGESLADIAALYNMEESDLIKLNNLREPYKLFTKQRLLVRVTGGKKAKEILNDGDVVIKELDDDEGKDGKAAMLDSANGLGTDGIGIGALNGEMPTPQIAPKAGEAAVNAKMSPVSDGVFDWPLKGKVVTNFGQKMPDGKVSDSLRIVAPVGTKVKAFGDGIVRDAGALLPGYGKMIVINHVKEKKMSVYAYLKDVYAKKGQTITKGQAIGTVGKNGPDPMLFFQVREATAGKKLVAVDPQKLLP